MRVLALVGSPRKGGNTETLVGAIAQGAAECGAEVETIRLNDLDIQMCQACDECKNPDAYTGCVLGDGMIQVHEKLEACDAFILGCPIYFFGPSAQAKVFLDRWYALWPPEGAKWESCLTGKRMALALVYGDVDPFSAGAINAYGTFRDAASYVGAKIVGVVYGTANDPGEIGANVTVMREARALGEKLACK